MLDPGNYLKMSTLLSPILPAWGYERRLARLRTSRGTFRLLAMDHGLSHGILDGIRDCDATLTAAVTAGFTGVVLNPGMIHRVKHPVACGVFIQLFGSPQTASVSHVKQELATVEDALTIGADGIAVQLDPFSHLGLSQLPIVARSLMQASRVGLPSLLMINVDAPKQFSPDRLLHAVRIGTELGATFVKVPLPARFSGADVERISKSAAVSSLVLLAGGPVQRKFQSALLAARTARFSGVCLGRNFFQSDDRDQVANILRKIFP
jgi:DhnA family fructose-bisphosphate aldolase class Ia